MKIYICGDNAAQLESLSQMADELSRPGDSTECCSTGARLLALLSANTANKTCIILDIELAQKGKGILIFWSFAVIMQLVNSLIAAVGLYFYVFYDLNPNRLLPYFKVMCVSAINKNSNYYSHFSANDYLRFIGVSFFLSRIPTFLPVFRCLLDSR